MMGIKKISLVLNTDDPEQAELFKFAQYLPNGKKRNTSAFLRLLVDRAYQSSKVEKKHVIRNQGGISIKLD